MRTLILTVIGIAALSVAPAAPSTYQITVSAEDGRVLWRLPVRPQTRVVLAYTNSIYGAATEERFAVISRGLELNSVASTSESVLAYNGLPAPYTKDGAYLVAGTKRVIPALVVRIGQTGRQQLIVGDSVLPLYTAGIGAQVRIEVLARRSIFR